jgi:ribosomal protein S3
LLASSISIDLEKNREHVKVLEIYRLILVESFSFWSTRSSSLEGCCVQVKGRLGNSDRSKALTIRKGAVSINKAISILDYNYKKAYTPFGIFGVKVWISYKLNNF